MTSYIFSHLYIVLFSALLVGVILGMGVVAMLKAGSDADDNFADIENEAYRNINDSLKGQITDLKNQLEHFAKDLNKAHINLESEKQARKRTITALTALINDDREQIEQLKEVRKAFLEIISDQKLKIAELNSDNLSLLKAVNIKNDALEAKIPEWSQPITGKEMIAESSCCEKVA